MLYYWLHTLYVFIGSKLFWSKIDIRSDLTRSRWVSIFDCESFRFMANTKYFFYMELARYELLFRSKLYDTTAKKEMFGVLGSQKIIYKRPLKRWSGFTITLSLEGWDDKWAYHRYTFKQYDQICAIGFTKIAFWYNLKAQDMNIILLNAGALETDSALSSEVNAIFIEDYNILKNSVL